VLYSEIPSTPLSINSFVCAIRRENAQPAFLRSYQSRRGQEVACKIWEACRATAAASSFFDPIKIGPFSEEFVDGATGFNNPINAVLAEAEDLWPGANPLENIQCVVSIGAGQPPLQSFGSNIFETNKTLVRMALETEKTAETFLRAHSRMHTESRYFRFNVLKGLEGIGIEEHKKMNVLAAATRNYLAGESIHIQTGLCIAALKGTHAPPDANTATSHDPQVPRGLDLQTNDQLSSSVPSAELSPTTMPLETGCMVEDVRTHDSFQSWLHSFAPSPATSSKAKGKVAAAALEQPTRSALPQTSNEEFALRMAKLKLGKPQRPPLTTPSVAVSGSTSFQIERASFSSGKLQDVPEAFKRYVRRRVQSDRQVHLIIKTPEGPREESVIEGYFAPHAPVKEVIAFMEEKGEDSMFIPFETSLKCTKATKGSVDFVFMATRIHSSP
jgi:hypothetical protein